MTRVESPPRSGQFLDEIEISRDLVSVAEEQKRRVVAVLFENGPHLPAEKVITCRIGFGILPPHGHLDFEVDPVSVGHAEGCTRRAPGVEPDVVEPVLPDDRHDPPPLVIAEGSVARFREDRILDRAPQMDRMSVQQDMIPALRHLAQSERNRPFIFARLRPGLCEQPAAQGIESGREFIPQRSIIPQRELARKAELRAVPAHGKLSLDLDAVARHRDERLAPERLPRGIGHRQTHLHAPVGNTRKELHVVDMDRIHDQKLHLAQNAVPVDLREFGVGMVPLVRVVLIAVVDAERNAVRLARGDRVTQSVRSWTCGTLT